MDWDETDRVAGRAVEKEELSLAGNVATLKSTSLLPTPL